MQARRFVRRLAAGLSVTLVAGLMVASAAPAGHASASIVAPRAAATTSGYWMVGSDGGIFSFGDSSFHGSMGGTPLNKPIVGMASTPDGQGYWLVGSDGGIFSFGDSSFHGSMGGTPLNRPIVGMASTPDGQGYWMVASDGGIFAFGDATFNGSMGGHPLNQPIVGMAATPDGQGYWMVASDGGIFAFGDATFNGSMGGHPLNQPIVGMAATPDGQGYSMVASDGGIFAFGDATFNGSMGGHPLNQPIVGMAAAGTGNGCDVLLTAPVGHHCLLPWPNDAFTVPSNTATGRQLNISSGVDPANVAGVHVGTTYQNQGDGFSPGSVIMTYVPNLDLTQSGIATSTDIGLSLAANAPIVIFDTVTHTRVPYFAELDAQTSNTAEQLLLIHPAVALTEGHRYAVALLNLVDTSGHPIPPLASTMAALSGTLAPFTRGAHIKSVIRDDLASVLGSTVPFMAWDFTVASAHSLAGPALTMHDLAYQWLGTHHLPISGTPTVPVADYAPSYAVTSVTTTAGVRDVHGTFQVPLFLQDTSPYSSMVTDASGAPAINGDLTWTANFICVMPSTMQPAGPAIPTVYGHGLLGSASEVEGSSFSGGVSRNMMGCATDWVGMSSNDLPNVARNLNDMSTWNTQVDHMLQGFVNFQFLGRLINSPAGFATSTAFQDGSQNALFQVGKCNFMGYSQGGIMGGAVSAVSTEWTHVILGVPGMDYGGLLLNRSTDWNSFASIFDKAYTDPVDEQVVLQLAQLLWDQGENEGYAEHLTSDPYPGIPAKQVFIIENYGDHQVGNASAEMLARTIGAQNHQPAFDPSFFGAAPRLDVPVTPQWGLTALDQSKPAPAGLVLWDYGTPTPPTTNLAPNGPAYGADPHGFGRGNSLLLDQITTFVSSGVIPNECGTSACQSSSP